MAHVRSCATCVLHRDLVVLLGDVDAVALVDDLLFDGHDV